MPWPIKNVNTIRQEFVTKAMIKGASFSGLCREYGISRKTGYKWRERALEDGLCRLAEHSRRPKSSPSQLDEKTACTLIRFKLRHPHWGPKKIRHLYARQFDPVPSLSSCQRVLTRAGLVVARPRRSKPATERIQIGAVARAPNEVWTVDFKGWWRVASGQRCEPLTVRDAFSRYVLAACTPPKADTVHLRTIFEQLFARHGLPLVIKSDNGAPFATATAPLGLSRLSAWWVALGIDLDRSRPAHPQDNGAHERLHKDIKAELASCVQPDLRAQQAALDQWREEFNWERPHESLDGRSPGEVYQRSIRSLPTGPIAIPYGPGFFPRKVVSNGTICWQSTIISISTALAGWDVGLRYQDNDHLEVWFAHLLVGYLELSSERFLRAQSRPPEPLTASA